MNKTKFKINKKRINKKGDISIWILAIGVTIFAISLIMYMNKLEDNLGDIGESTIKILNNFESTERLFFYMDASIELAAKSAEQKVLENSGYASEKYKGAEIKSKCGKLNYPIIDASKNIDECFPDYEQVIKTKFTREMNVLFLQYDPFEIDPSMFSTTEKKGENSILLSVASTSTLNMPIYAYIESYYKNADKTRFTTNNELVYSNEDGYLTSRMYLSLTSFERDIAPTKILIQDTGTQSVDETYRELFTGLNNYNYVIDAQGKIFLFTPENRYTKGANCKKQESQTCLIEDIDANSISIAIVNKIPANKHTDKQIESLKKLIADIAFRNSQIEITDTAIILNNEIDSSRKDPAVDIKSLKATIISDAKLFFDAKTPTKDGSSEQNSNEDNSNTNSGNSVTNNVIFNNDVNNIENVNINNNDEKNNEITGMASAPPSNIDELVCFTNVVTTKYFTPNCEDYVWTSGKTHPKDECYIVNKGFYEEVKCQGSGYCDGRVYYHSTIQKTKEASEPLDEEYTHGITAAGTDPQIRKTVAAKWSCSGLSKFSKLYIYWGENSDWNGYYVVEDKGSAIDTCDHLDIYVGMGKEDLANANFNSASKNANGNDLAKVCVLDENFEMPDPDFSSNSDFVDIITGNSEVYYAHSTQIKNITKLFEGTKQALSKIIASCKANTNTDEKNNCINSEMEKAKTTNNLKLEYCTNEDYEDISYINTLPAPTAPLSSTYAPKILGTIIDNPNIITQDGTQASYAQLMQETENEQNQNTNSQQTQNTIIDLTNKKILAIGDSRTGSGTPNYPAELQTILTSNQISGTTVIKRNYDSCSTTIIKECLMGSEREECKNSCYQNANYNYPKININDYDIIIIWGSRNNIYNSNQVINDLKEMYAYAKSKGKIVIAITLAPGPSQYIENTNKVNEFILNKPQNVDYVINAYEILVDEKTQDMKEEYRVRAGDTHQNGIANNLIAQKIYDTIKDMGNNEPANYMPYVSNDETSYVLSSLIPIQNTPPVSASIKIKDSTGEITINLTGKALEWVNFSNKESFLYTEGLMLKKGDTILVSLNHDYANQVYYADEFSDIIPEPEDVAHIELLNIVKTLGECSSSGFSCDCKIEPTRVLKNIKIENGTIENMETGEKMLTDFFVTMTHEVDVSSGKTFIVIGNYISVRYPTTTTKFDMCAPNAEYKYICASLIDDESLGTIGYALKI